MESMGSSPNTLRLRVGVPRHVVFRDFVSETVLLNIQTGQYHGLNPTAGRMLELLGQLGSPAAVSDAVAKEFEQPLEVVQRDVNQLCEALLERGLLEVHGADG